jgi:hypothetical protein
MERDLLEIEARAGTKSRPFRYGLAAAAIWVAVVYGLCAPSTAHPGRVAARAATALAQPCAK